MEHTTRDRRVWIKGLAMECPLGKPLGDCPLNDTSSLPVAQINHTINGHSSRKVNDLYRHHLYCYRIRSTVLSIQQTKRLG